MKYLLRLWVCVVLLAFAGTPIFANDAVSAVDLFNTAKQDVEGTARKYADGPLTVRGVAVTVGPDIHNLPSIGLSDRDGGAVYAHCVLDEGDASGLNRVKTGQEVVIRGSYLLFSTGEVFGNDEMVVLKQCGIVE